MGYVIGIKRKFLGSENEVEWKYACEKPSTSPFNETSYWGSFEESMTFSDLEGANAWWLANGAKLLAEPRVLANTAEIRRVELKSEKSLPLDVIDEETADRLKSILEDLARDFEEARKLLPNDEAFRNRFLTQAFGIWEDYAGSADSLGTIRRNARKTFDDKTKEASTDKTDEKPTKSANDDEKNEEASDAERAFKEFVDGLARAGILGFLG